jgi:hypothetical protein
MITFIPFRKAANAAAHPPTPPPAMTTSADNSLVPLAAVEPTLHEVSVSGILDSIPPATLNSIKSRLVILFAILLF